MTVTFHVREKLAPRGGSHLYRDKTIRATATVCGAPVTAYDVRFQDRCVLRLAAKLVWTHEGITYHPCTECLKEVSL